MDLLHTYEHDITQLDKLLDNETGTALDDGRLAVQSLQSQLWTPRQHEGDAQSFIESEGTPLSNNMIEIYGPSDTDNPRHTDLETIGDVLKGAFVIASLSPTKSLPGIIAPQQNSGELTLFLSRKAWRSSGLTETQQEVLAAAAQLEAPGVGEHQSGDAPSAAEAQHLVTQFGIARSPHHQAAWRAGNHVNHTDTFKRQGTLSTTSATLLGENGVITAQVRKDHAGVTQISLNNRPFAPAPGLAVYWDPETMQHDNEQGVAVGDSARALTIVQAAGFRAVQDVLPSVRETLRA